MKESPIIFNAPMVNAILDGRKSQTRRVIRPQPEVKMDGEAFPDGSGGYTWEPVLPSWCRWPFQIGDYLWVREACRAEELGDDTENPGLDGVRYRADNAFIPIENSRESSERWMQLHAYGGNGCWVPSIHMPRWASRITLEITGIRVERVQEISADDIPAEGTPDTPHDSGCLVAERQSFVDFWNSINAKRGFGWDANPWVWVVEFKLVQP